MRVTFLLSVLLRRNSNCNAFIVVDIVQRSSTTPSSAVPYVSVTTTTLHERKKGTGKAKGFGKVNDLPTNLSSPISPKVTELNKASAPPVSTSTMTPATPQFLQSIDTLVTGDSASATNPEDRAKQVLRDKYGMKTLAEQQLDAQQLARRNEEQKKWAELKKKVATASSNSDDEFDLFSVLPAPVLIGIDLFLKAGTTLCSVLFVASGVLIAAEAWSKASGDPLPSDWDDFIVRTIEPNFTPGLIVLLSFSVSLGIFASLQLGSRGASYKED
jgi:hypothetical protein